jgi:hypothetical protein
MKLRVRSSLFAAIFSAHFPWLPKPLRAPRNSTRQSARFASLTTSPGRIFYPERSECASDSGVPGVVPFFESRK